MFLLQLLQTPPTYALPLFIHFFSIKTSSLFILKYVSHWVQLVLSTCAKHWGQTLGWAICQRPQLQVCKNESFSHRLPTVPQPGMDPWESLPLPGWELNCLEVVQVMNTPVNSVCHSHGMSREPYITQRHPPSSCPSIFPILPFMMLPQACNWKDDKDVPYRAGHPQSFILSTFHS